MALPPNSSLAHYSAVARPEAPRPGDTPSGPPATTAAAAAAASSASTTSNGTTAAAAHPLQKQLNAPKRLQRLLAEVDPSYALDEEAAEIVLHLVEEFAGSVARAAATAARHRGSPAIEHGDVAFALLKQWNMAVPAVGPAGAGDAGGGGGGKKGGGGGGGGKRKR